MTGARVSWLDRIGIDAVPDPTVATLGRILRHHLCAVPFENLDVLSGGVPRLDPAALHDKVILQRRGGYCFELNGILSSGLASLGFTLRPQLARVLWQKSVPGPKTHLFLKVDAEGSTWLVDAGFGGPCPDVPIPLGADRAGAVPAPYVLTREPDLGTVLSRRTDDGRTLALYAFQDDRIGPADIEAANWLAATLPGTLFRRRVMAAIGDGRARCTLDGRRFTRTVEGVLIEDRMLGGAADVSACLTEAFGLSPSRSARQAIAASLNNELPERQGKTERRG